MCWSSTSLFDTLMKKMSKYTKIRDNVSEYQVVDLETITAFAASFARFDIRVMLAVD